MSRHRDFRNLNIRDELDDDALSDGGEEEMTEEQRAQMLDGLEHVRAVLGGEEVSGLSDKDIKDALWEYFFDQEQTIQWALEEQQRRQLARERKEPYQSKDLPPLPPGDGEPPSNVEYYHPERFPPQDQGEPIERSRMPAIFQAQQQQGYPEPVDVPEIETPRVVRPVLSTITEITERTEATPRWPPGQHFMRLNTPRPPSSMSTSSYGAVIEPSEPLLRSPGPIDPNTIPVSPSGSALNRLSLYEPAPSVAMSESQSTRSSPPHSSSEPVPPTEGLPEIPDYNSKSSKQAPLPIPPPKQSKLSLLASSRASSMTSRSESSRSSGIALTGSVKTFPALRPSPQSARPPSSATTSRPLSAQPVLSIPHGENAGYYDASNTGSSSMASHVRRAIQTALILEAEDQQPTPKPSPSQSPRISTTSAAPVDPAPTESSASHNLPAHPYKEVQTFRAPSKLALLAQAKSKAAKTPKLPKPVTEYLTPIANGPTVTTAITTSYQNLYSLTDPAHSRVIPEQYVVPLGVTPPEPKVSKLAMKIKKASEKQPPVPVADDEIITPPVSPMFYAKSSAHVHKVKDRGSRRRDNGHKGSIVFDEPSIATLETPRSRSRKHRHDRPPVPDFSPPLGFAFDAPSPDDIVFNARPAKEREKAQKRALGSVTAPSSRPSSAVSTPTKKKPGPAVKKHSGSLTPARGPVDQKHLDLSALNLTRDDNGGDAIEEPPKLSFAREKLLEEAKRALDAEEENQKRGISLIVVGHVDAGKSTLMGRLLYELGRLNEKTRIANERGSSKAGKSSFSWAWGLDGTTEERERGITMDIAQQSLTTPHRQVTILDAPGHKDFIPNMISGASQADCALLVVDAAHGEFEAGFDRGGQTREHLLLVRSLGVSQVIVAINKLDQVDWDSTRYEEICSVLRPFLVQTGFHPSKTRFVPVGAMKGVNLAVCEGNDAMLLKRWYKGPTLVDLLDVLEPPTRDILAPLRIPISNVFRSHGSGAAVSGRLCGGVVQVGEKLRILPGDETAIVKSIDVDEENVPWAAAGTNATFYLTSVDPVNVHIGNVLCSMTELVPLATCFTARIIVFDIQVPITAGTSVELFHHSRDVPATLSKLISTIDRASGKVLKMNPRVLTKGTSAEVQISLRSTTLSSGPTGVRPIPLETFAVNKDMGRILIRRGGETIGAGIVMSIDG
ncbi:HBS1-like protein [Hypsizygus marmoreus]|uniref:Elongation factor 1 alpha-like protein n=1 Tax=Hypsizygus marmoreus TaxID=39966 RepID=A0A369JNW1_HYPMA|nr:HBS1-like protein [Hypsizygus marmoreus]